MNVPQQVPGSRQLWRLSNYERLESHSMPGGRWVPPGISVIVLDESPLAAICARLALAEAEHPRQLPRNYCLLAVEVPQEAIAVPVLPRSWQADRLATRATGLAWLDQGSALLLRVPAVAGGFQYLLNCRHAAMAQCRVLSVMRAPFLPYESQVSAFVSASGGWLARTPGLGRQDWPSVDK